MRGDGSTLKRIPRVLLVQVQMAKEQRNAFRLLLCIREFIGNKFYVKDPIHVRILMDVCKFSDYQIKNYTKVLVKAGMMRRDKKGNFYCYKLSKICPSPKRGNGKYRMSNHRDIDVSVILDSNRFKKYLRGHPVMTVADTRERTRRGKKKAACYAGQPIQGDGNRSYVFVHNGRTIFQKDCLNLNIAQGVSLSNLMLFTGMSKSTMSKWRKEGQEAGYEVWEAYQPINKAFENMPLWKLQQYLVENNLTDELDPNLLKTVMIYGKPKVMMQVPSQIVMHEGIFYYA